MLRFFYLVVALVLSVTVTQAQQKVQFVNPMPIPYKVTGPNFNMNIGPAMHNFDPNGAVTQTADRFGETPTPININNAVEAYAYNDMGNTGMTYLGPTIVVQKGDWLNFNFTNNLPGGQRTTVHWHGLNLPASQDGGPHQVIDGNGGTWNSSFSMVDPLQTVWYHSHLMDSTTEQVIRGTAGMMIVEDVNDQLHTYFPRDYGVNDIPIIIQEKDFEFTNGTATEIKAGEKPGNGRFTLVNGVAGAVIHVPRQMVRLRLLNGSPRKMYGIGMATSRDNPSLITMYQSCSGGGYLQYVNFVDSTLLSVGDRKEFIFDFTSYSNGDTVYMINCYLPTDALYLNGNGGPITSEMPASADRAIMAFVVDNSINPTNPVFSIPVTPNPNYTLAPGPVFRTRTKELRKDPKPGGGHVWTINGDTMNMMVINDTVLVNTKEKWIIKNETDHAHPFHIHKVQFQVVEYTGRVGFSDDSTTTYTYPNLPSELIGWKDVQLVRAGATMAFEARFDSFPSPAISPMEGFMYHCHILTHEDNSMMGQFVVVDSLAYYTNTNNVSITKSLFVYPNPAGDVISFDADNVNGRGTLRIYDITGRMLREENNMFLSGRSINVSDLPRGMIFVEFSTEKDRYLQKVLLH